MDVIAHSGRLNYHHPDQCHEGGGAVHSEEHYRDGVVSSLVWKTRPFAAFIFAVFLAILVMGSPSTHAEEDQPVQAGPATQTPSDEEQNSFLTFLYGKTPKNGVLFLPFGMHLQSHNKSISHNNLIGVVYNSFSVGTFINSFHDRTWYLVWIRNIYASHGFGIDYFAGALYGYKGQLARTGGIPFSNTFLFKHNLNPVISVDGWYEFSDHLQMQVMLTPRVVLGGIKYNF